MPGNAKLKKGNWKLGTGKWKLETGRGIGPAVFAFRIAICGLKVPALPQTGIVESTSPFIISGNDALFIRIRLESMQLIMVASFLFVMPYLVESKGKSANGFVWLRSPTPQTGIVARAMRFILLKSKNIPASFGISCLPRSTGEPRRSDVFDLSDFEF
jgi:hypothetical protein